MSFPLSRLLPMTRVLCIGVIATLPLSGAEPQPTTPSTTEENDPELSRYLDMSLSELLNVSVVTGSKRLEPNSDTPAVITVYTARDLEMMGYYTLADLADKTPGYSSYSIYGERVFETRGQKAGSFNNNLLKMFYFL